MERSPPVKRPCQAEKQADVKKLQQLQSQAAYQRSGLSESYPVDGMDYLKTQT